MQWQVKLASLHSTCNGYAQNGHVYPFLILIPDRVIGPDGRWNSKSIVMCFLVSEQDHSEPQVIPGDVCGEDLYEQLSHLCSCKFCTNSCSCVRGVNDTPVWVTPRSLTPKAEMTPHDRDDALLQKWWAEIFRITQCLNFQARK